jgi:hypothetical protein
MTDLPTHDPGGQVLRLRYRVTTGFSPFPGVTVAWYEAVDFHPEDGAAIALALADNDGHENTTAAFAIGRAVLRIDTIPHAAIDARRGHDGLLVPRLRAEDAEPRPGATLTESQRLIDTWRAIWEAVEAATASEQPLRAQRRGIAGDSNFFEIAVSKYVELLDVYEDPSEQDLANALYLSRTTLWRALSDRGREFADIQREARMK